MFGLQRTFLSRQGPSFATCGFALAALLLWHPPAFAYIDPGTGSALVYVVTGLLVSSYFFLRGMGYRIVEMVMRRGKGQKACELAIHCESPRYETTFLPIVRELATRDLQVTFFTMYPRDESYDPLPENVIHQEIAPGMVGYALLNHLEAKVLATTTPQLDVMTFRRSKRVGHYVMVQHAIGESRYVRPFAYDFFDTVLCCGDILKSNIRTIEGIRGLPEKNLLDTGVPHFDEFKKHVGAPSKTKTEKPLVLVAPSWGPQSIFQAFGTELVEHLAERFDVLVRPHPQMKISQPEIYERVLGLKGVEVDTARTPVDAMARANVLVSDISGIAHEFAFIHEKPVVIIDHEDPEAGLGGLEGEVVGGPSRLRERCSEFIIPIPPEKMPEIADVVAAALESPRTDLIVSVREKTVYNYGHASAVAAAQIAELVECA